MELTWELREAVEESGLPVLGEVLAALDQAFNNVDWSVFDAIARAREALDDFEGAVVRFARVDGLTWDEIGKHLGLSRQGAQKRFKGIGVEELDALEELHKHQIEAMGAEIRLQTVRGVPQGAELGDRVSALINRQLAERAEVRARLAD